MKNSNRSAIVDAAHEEYSEEQIRADPDLSEMDKTLLWKMHLLDNPKLGFDGCRASNNTLANYVGSVPGAAKSRIKRLREHGYFVTVNYTESGMPPQPVRAKYGLLPGVDASRITTAIHGTAIFCSR